MGDEIALAWFFHEQPGYFSHDGKSGGYNSRLAFYPEKDRAIVVLYNRDHLSAAGLSQLVNRIADNIEELMSGRPTTRIDFDQLQIPRLCAICLLAEVQSIAGRAGQAHRAPAG